MRWPPRVKACARRSATRSIRTSTSASARRASVRSASRCCRRRPSSRTCSPRRSRRHTRSTSSARRCSPIARSRDRSVSKPSSSSRTRRALAANIVVATINAASLQAQVEATEQLVALGEQRAQQIAARARLGGASHDDVLAAEQDAANAAATLPGLRAQALAVRHAQAVLLGRMPDQAPAPLPLDALHVPENVPVAVPSALLHQRPDILAAEGRRARGGGTRLARPPPRCSPSLTLSASYGRGGFDWSTFTSPAGMIWGIGASLSQPLFHGGALLAASINTRRAMTPRWPSTSRPCSAHSRTSPIRSSRSTRTRTP
ncbi:MAG: TolC family protein [Pararobbsia sp.]